MFIIQSILLCAIFTYIIIKVMENPIKGILSYPPAIRKRVEALPKYQNIIVNEKKGHLAKKLISIPIIAIIFTGTSWLGGARSFSEAFFYNFSLFLVLNILDLIVLDWLWFCRSSKVRLEGTEDMIEEYQNIWFHLKGFFKGVIIGVVVSLLSASIFLFI